MAAEKKTLIERCPNGGIFIVGPTELLQGGFEPFGEGAYAGLRDVGASRCGTDSLADIERRLHGIIELGIPFGQASGQRLGKRHGKCDRNREANPHFLFLPGSTAEGVPVIAIL